VAENLALVMANATHDSLPDIRLGDEIDAAVRAFAEAGFEVVELRDARFAAAPPGWPRRVNGSSGPTGWRSSSLDTLRKATGRTGFWRAMHASPTPSPWARRRSLSRRFSGSRRRIPARRLS
jgi:hypothetical protein